MVNWKEAFVWIVGLLCVAALLIVGVDRCADYNTTDRKADNAEYLKCINSPKSKDVRDCRSAR